MLHEGSFDGMRCRCGGGAFFQSRITLWERLGFAVGLWSRSDLTNVMAVTTTLGGEINSHMKKVEPLLNKES